MLPKKQIQQKQPTQKVRWLTFCSSHAMSKTIVHFFPSSENASAPYTAHCSLTLFGKDIPRTTVQLDGARLGHPDGVRLEDAFPILKQGATGLFGLDVEIATSQPRLDIDCSECIIEIIFQGFPVRFSPIKMPMQRSIATDSGDQESSEPQLTTMALRDSASTASVCLVNGSPIAVTAAGLGIQNTSQNYSDTEAPEALFQTVIEPGSALEITIPDSVFDQSPSIETSWGSLNAFPLEVVFSSSQSTNTPVPTNVRGGTSQGIDAQCAAYLVHREISSKRLISVMSVTAHN